VLKVNCAHSRLVHSYLSLFTALVFSQSSCVVVIYDLDLLNLLGTCNLTVNNLYFIVLLHSPHKFQLCKNNIYFKGIDTRKSV
jgi:hypothetical protein